MNKKPVLGRGLNSLFNSEDSLRISSEPSGSSQFNEVSISQIFPNPDQPRKEFNEEALKELAISIEKNGLISPITLRKVDEDHYQIIAGERRFRASQLVGIESVPAYIKTVSDEDILELALIENIQREDLNAIEIALTYNTLAENYSMTQQELSERLGKKRATIANYMRLLKLPAEIQMGVKDKKIDMGHARALAGINDAAVQLNIYNFVLQEGCSVRKTEELVRDYNKKGKTTSKKEKRIMPESYNTLRSSLSSLFTTKVQFSYNDKGKGKISIPFTSDDDLMRIMELLDKIK